MRIKKSSGKKRPGRLRRAAVTAGALFCGFILLYFCAVFFGGIITVTPQQTVSAGIHEKDADTFIFLDDNGRHFDVWLPTQYCGFLDIDDNPLSGGWYGFGWGDRDFFLNTPYAADVRPGILLKALFLPSRSVLAVQYSERTPLGRASVTAVPVSGKAAAAAADYIAGWFYSGKMSSSVPGGIRKIPESLAHPSYKGYRFYESRGKYSLFFTSNNWVNRVLKASGQATGLWTPMTFGIVK